MKIANIFGRQIFDSRGHPTIESDVILNNGIIGRAAVPSGASTGINEAVELRDNNKERHHGNGVLGAVNNINLTINNKLIGMDSSDQEKIDQTLIDLDGTPNKAKLGANAILAVSLATAKAEAKNKKLPLFKYINSLMKRPTKMTLPIPMVNIINGGKHAHGSTDIQEFMIVPLGAKNFNEALRMSSEIFHHLHNVLKEKGYPTTVGDEGGFAPRVKNGNKEALDLIVEAIKKSGYILGKDVALALDVAASELYENGLYHLKTENKSLTSSEMVEWISNLVKKYPIISIEDGLDQDDWQGWITLNKKIGKKIQVVGDDLLVTNTKFLERAVKEKAANTILIKLNQIGTLTETIQAIEMANTAGWKSIISHRSGETEDTTIAHLAVGAGTGQIKAGSMSRTDRMAKYNELLRIEEELGKNARFGNSKKRT